MRAGAEHRALHREGFDSQITVKQIDGQDCLEYIEDMAMKTNQGGLKHEQLDAKNSVVYPSKISSRCPVEIFKLYLSKVPSSYTESALYLKPSSKKQLSRGYPWFQNIPIGQNTLAKVVGRVTKNAALEGFFTNHSLRASCATVLYNDDCNLPEQVIAEKTGHRSLAIRSYKRTKNTLKREVSDILTNYSAGVAQDEKVVKTSKLKPLKHEYLKQIRDGKGLQGNVHNVKVDICLSLDK